MNLLQANYAAYSKMKKADAKPSLLAHPATTQLEWQSRTAAPIRYPAVAIVCCVATKFQGQVQIPLPPHSGNPADCSQMVGLRLPPSI
jgi:hypothetical protein